MPFGSTERMDNPPIQTMAVAPPVATSAAPPAAPTPTQPPGQALPQMPSLFPGGSYATLLDSILQALLQQNLMQFFGGGSLGMGPQTGFTPPNPASMGAPQQTQQGFFPGQTGLPQLPNAQPNFPGPTQTGQGPAGTMQGPWGWMGPFVNPGGQIPTRQFMF